MTTYENIAPNWNAFEKRPTWGYVSTPELAEILGVSLQTINNWLLRGKLPNPNANHNFKGNKNYWKISELKSFFEHRKEDEIHNEWIKANLFDDQEITIPQAMEVVAVAWDVFGVEKVALQTS